MEFAVVGGDMRTVRLAELLMRDGHGVRVYGLEGEEAAALPKAGTLARAIEAAEYVILPLPATRGALVNAPLTEEKIPVSAVAEALRPGQTVLAGKAEGELTELARARGARVADYFTREELTVKNAGATAEGAVEILMRELPVTLMGSSILVVGFGRIGKLLALKLRALGANVTCSARKSSDRAWIEVLGLRPADTGRLADVLPEADAVVNTVPARVLGERELRMLRDGCLCLDLASKPGGVDLQAAGALGTRVIWALSLPGQVAPVTAGEAIRDAVYNIIYELESE